MRNTISQRVASNFAYPRLVEGEKFAATPVVDVRVRLRGGSGVPGCAPATVAMPQVQPHMGRIAVDARGRSPISVTGIAARGAPV